LCDIGILRRQNSICETIFVCNCYALNTNFIMRAPSTVFPLRFWSLYHSFYLFLSIFQSTCTFAICIRSRRVTPAANRRRGSAALKNEILRFLKPRYAYLLSRF
ncbi:hypothetical protein GOODEAATRI_024814, partial [Goodea atripinnis]